ncbi:MAG: CRTAC1 family protein [Candidatus Sulfotelmatobacter sp.]
MIRREFLRWLATAPLVAAAARCEALANAASSPAPNTPAGIRFRDVTAQAGLHFVHSGGPRNSLLPEDMGSGLAWGDYDNDGFPDLYVVNQPSRFGSGNKDGLGNHLFHNNGNGTFTDVTEHARLELHHFGMGAYWGDYDNDGLLDLFVTGVGGCYLYHNEGNGRFRDVTKQSGVFDPLWSTGAVWVDFDNDGWLDLYVLHYVDYPVDVSRLHFAQESQYGVVIPAALNPRSFRPQPNRLLRNNRDGTFTDVTHRAGVVDPEGRSLTVTAADFNLDGWPELYVGNDLSMNRFFLNTKNSRFADRSTQTLTSENKGSMGLAVGDFDRDGDLDFFVSHWLSLGNSLYQNLFLESHQLGFADAAEFTNLAYISLPMVGWGCTFLDYDNDGLLDLVVVNGNTLEDTHNHKLLVPQKPFLFHYDGTQYQNVLSSVASDIDRPLNARGLAAADFDNDGDIDLAISCNRGPLILLRADGAEGRNWIKVSLQGRKSNRQGIGSLVRVSAGGGTWVQSVGSQGSYLSQHATPLHFGLGSATSVDRIEVVWPGGHRQTVDHPRIRQHLHLRED